MSETAEVTRTFADWERADAPDIEVPAERAVVHVPLSLFPYDETDLVDAMEALESVSSALAATEALAVDAKERVKGLTKERDVAVARLREIEQDRQRRAGVPEERGA